jgi:hypothetical protein
MKPVIEAFLTDYLAELVEGNAAIFAGAGLSAAAGFVDWRELVRPLCEELGLNIDLETDLIAVAQFHVNAHGSNRHKVHKAIIDALSPDVPPTENHRLLAQLPIKDWWTTNYDKLIESALRAAGKIVDVKSAVPQLATTRQRRDAIVYKMHGDVERPDEAVVTRDDYEKYFTQREAFVTALAGDLVAKTFLFIGFSFTDPNLEQVLSRVRLRFASNQRRHYALFRVRTQLSGESPEDFEHARTRQELVIEDLKRFNVRVLLVDQYSEITDILRELCRRYRRRTVFISGSVFDYAPWGQKAVSEFAQELGSALIANGVKVSTGLGLGIGDAIFTGALRQILATQGSIEDSLILRPFPQSGEVRDLEPTWEEYRKEILAHSGVAIFLFGNKQVDGQTKLSDGVRREFQMAHERGIVVIPIGATGSVAREIAEQLFADQQKLEAQLGAEGAKLLQSLSEPTDDLASLVPKIIELIRKLRAGSGL